MSSDTLKDNEVKERGSYPSFIQHKTEMEGFIPLVGGWWLCHIY